MGLELATVPLFQAIQTSSRVRMRGITYTNVQADVLFLTAYLPFTAQLTVVVEEARATGTSPQMVLIVEEMRVFDLAPGLTYRIHCRSVVGFGGLSGVWQDGEGTAIETRNPAPALDFDEAAVYSTPRNPDSTNEWSLVLQSFSQNGTRTYVCPSAEEGGTDAVLQIGMSEWSGDF